MANAFYGLRRQGLPGVSESLTAEALPLAVSWRTVEGEDGTGQTASLSLLADEPPDYDAFLLELSDGSRTAALYYDVAGHSSGDGAGQLYEMRGTQDRFFEEVYAAISAGLLRRASTAFQQPPAALWVTDVRQRIALTAKLQSLIRAAVDLRQARSVLSQYGMTLEPLRTAGLTFSGNETEKRGIVSLLRDYRLQWRYPNDATTAANRLLTLPAGSVARPEKPRLEDRLNGPGDYASRPIIAGWREPGGQVRSYAGEPSPVNLRDLRRIVIDVEQANRDVGLYALRLRRWELQNTSARVTFRLADPDLRVGVNSLLKFDGDYALTGLPDYGDGAGTMWRVAKVTRAHSGPEFHTTEIEAAVWQGLPRG